MLPDQGRTRHCLIEAGTGPDHSVEGPDQANKVAQMEPSDKGTGLVRFEPVTWTRTS